MSSTSHPHSCLGAHSFGRNCGEGGGYRQGEGEGGLGQRESGAGCLHAWPYTPKSDSPSQYISC
eukprot:1366532-Rhodomonas_salina.2